MSERRIRIDSLTQPQRPIPRIAAAIRTLRRTWPAAFEVLFPEASELGIGVGLCDALIILALRHPDGVTMSTLAESMRVEASTATRTVDRMVEKGIAQRVRSTEDGRVFLVKPTRWGFALQDRLTQHAAEMYDVMLRQEFTNAELKQLAGLLERLEFVFEQCASSER